jgi:uncharacterized protein
MLTEPQLDSPLIKLGDARVMHARLRPFVHRFFYKVFCLQIRLDQPTALNRLNTWLFGINKKRPISFMNADHGARDGSDLMVWLKQTLRLTGHALPGGQVWLQCFPRMFGYVFNPVSFWFLYDQQGQLILLLAEVNNTFGQRHQYVLSDEQGGVLKPGCTVACEKVFHVSPFCSVKGEYKFTIQQTSKGEKISIDYFDDPTINQALVLTAITTEFQKFSMIALVKRLLHMPFMTLGVMVRIHLQAFKLWRRGAKFHSTPPLGQHTVTTNKGGDLEHD